MKAVWDRAEEIGSVIVEPIQARGGVRVPPPGFLAELASLARARGALVIADEIYTGFGRAGAWFRFEAEGFAPDLLCVGKALGGGLPVSACIGPIGAMTAWGDPGREALHTSTFLGHPLACAAALAFLDVARTTELADLATEQGRQLRTWIASGIRHDPRFELRGEGLLLGLACPCPGDGLRLTQQLLSAGYLCLPAGKDAEVLSITPPATITGAQLEAFSHALANAIRSLP